MIGLESVNFNADVCTLAVGKQKPSAFQLRVSFGTASS
jgi:hypothetical protein